jgi:N,N-dimethylformamidase
VIEDPEPQAELIGYADRLSVAPGQTIRFYVSTDAPDYHLRIVRMLHGDTNPAGPGHREQAIQGTVEGRFPGRSQRAHAGSFAVVPQHPLVSPTGAYTLGAFVLATTPECAREQGLISVWSQEDGKGTSLRLDDEGVVTLWVGGSAVPVKAGPLLRREWYFVAAGIDIDRRTAMCAVRPLSSLGAQASSTVTAALSAPIELGRDLPLLLGAVSRPRDAGRSAEAAGHFNGKLEAPRIYPRLLSEAEIDDAAAGAEPCRPAAYWDFGRSVADDHVHDIAAEHHGRLINMPTQAVTGHRWGGEQSDPAHAPDQYGAIHFHDDDLEDAGWESDAAWLVPSSLPSGTYAARLDGAGRVDHIPFVVRPPVGVATADIGVLLPTLTYLAYANEGIVASGVADKLMVDGVGSIHWADRYVGEHPEWGRSLYDDHDDGSGVCYSSRLRPIPNMRPGYRFWSTGAPERYAADLYLIDWLDHERQACDVFTDEDLHDDGRALLERYKVVLTGAHPEYWTGPMLDAVEGYLAGGGRLMYLGGNGFYWVTSISADKPHIIEVRRGFNGTRAWESAPGEAHHSTTGEPGGLWRYRGRPPNRLVGVGFTAQSDAQRKAPGYHLLPDAEHPEVAFVFEGIGRDEIIGDFGLINGGAAGYEIDRYDPEIGAPHSIWHLATSQGMHDESYLLTIENLLFTVPEITGPTQHMIRADVVYAKVGRAGGEVFSVGSCNWCGSLSHDGYGNNVSRVTSNVLRRFLR